LYLYESLHRRETVNMRALFAIVFSAIALAGCNSDNDVTGSVESCAKKLYAPYNPKNMKQCVRVCIDCERGIITTCTTSCTLKGAR
jgi:PBP1b-binding outer membrane lipoprotein LpoB